MKPVQNGYRPWFWALLGFRCAQIAWERRRLRQLIAQAPWTLVIPADGSAPRLIDELRAA